MQEKLEENVASQESETSEESSQEGLSSVVHVNNLMTILLENDSPHLMFLDPNFDLDYFNENRQAVFELLGDKGPAIAEKLADSTPKEVRSNIARLVQNTFPNTDFPNQVQAAFERRREQELTQPLEEKPKDGYQVDKEDSTTESYSTETDSGEEQQASIIVDGKAFKDVEIIKNPTFFAQSQLNKRNPKGLEPASLPHAVDDDNVKGATCCEKYCSLF